MIVAECFRHILCLGSAKIKITADKEVGVFTHQKIITTGSCFNNAGILQDHWLRFVSAKHKHYPNSTLILLKYQKKILRIEGQSPDFTVTTNKNTYKSKIIVLLAQQILFN
jgi:hypothetical protein